MRSLACITSLAGLALLSTATAANAWEFQELMNGQGDRGLGIIQPATNTPGIAFGFGCEGDRWRQVAILPGGKNAFPLSTSGTLRFGFAPDALGPPGTWKVRTPPDTPPRYFAPAPTQLMERLYNEEGRNPEAILYVKLRPSKKDPVVLQFPLAGMRAALAKHLWKPCKLDVYFGDPE